MKYFFNENNIGNDDQNEISSPSHKVALLFISGALEADNYWKQVDISVCKEFYIVLHYKEYKETGIVQPLLSKIKCCTLNASKRCDLERCSLFYENIGKDCVESQCLLSNVQQIVQGKCAGSIITDFAFIIILQIDDMLPMVSCKMINMVRYHGVFFDMAIN